MSTSLLYHAFGIRGDEYARTDDSSSQTIFAIRHETGACRCSTSGSRNIQPRGYVERRFRTPPIGSRPTFLDLPIARVECRICGVIRQVAIPFAKARRSYTKTFERYVLELSRSMTIRDVALHLNVGWDLVKEIPKRDLLLRFAKPKLKHPRGVAIDEIAVAKGHRYLTVVMNRESGAVVFVGDGNGADALKPFWKRLRSSKAVIEAVAMDMSPAYRGAVSTHLPKTKIVFDRFHVVKLFSEKLSDLRRALHREAIDKMRKDVLKGTRWLLLKNPENLDIGKNEKLRLEEAEGLNKPPATAYSMKEDLRRFWEQPGMTFATGFLDDGIRRTETSGIRMLQPTAKTLTAHRSGLLAYYDVKLTSGPMEGTNNKINTMKRQAYGFRDQEFFKLKILAIHEMKYAFVG